MFQINCFAKTLEITIILQILRWQTQHTIEKFHLEKQNEITDLKSVIETLKPTNKTKNKIGSLTTGNFI